MMNNDPLVIVIGGVNCDISGTPDAAMRLGDSNPGRITVSAGGVGRNIAENLARLGRKVSLLGALGEDANGEFIRSSCRVLGIDLSLAQILPDQRTSTYLCLNDEKGEVLGAVSDMAICDRLTPALMQEKLPQLQRAAMIVMDANLPQETIRWVSQHVECPIMADPVSVAKAGRLRGALGRFTLIKPNVPQAQLLTGVEIHDDEDLHRAAEAFRQAGLMQTVISLGSRGVYWNDGTQWGIRSCLPMEVINTNGCGDAFLAACAHACLMGMPLQRMVDHGIAASAICAQSQAAVSDALTHEGLMACMARYL